MKRPLELMLVLLMVLLGQLAAADEDDQLMEIKIHDPVPSHHYTNSVDIMYTLQPLYYKNVDFGQPLDLHITLWHATGDFNTKRGKKVKTTLAATIQHAASVAQQDYSFLTHSIEWNAAANHIVSGYYAVEFSETFHSRGGNNSYCEDIFIYIEVK